MKFRIRSRTIASRSNSLLLKRTNPPDRLRAPTRTSHSARRSRSAASRSPHTIVMANDSAASLANAGTAGSGSARPHRVTRAICVFNPNPGSCGRHDRRNKIKGRQRKGGRDSGPKGQTPAAATRDGARRGKEIEVVKGRGGRRACFIPAAIMWPAPARN